MNVAGIMGESGARAVQSMPQRRSSVPQRADGSDASNYQIADQELMNSSKKGNVFDYQSELAAQHARIGVGRVENGGVSLNEFKRSSALDALSIAIIGLNKERLVSIQTQLSLQFPLAEMLLVAEVACYSKLLSIKLIV